MKTSILAHQKNKNVWRVSEIRRPLILEIYFHECTVPMSSLLQRPTSPNVRTRIWSRWSLEGMMLGKRLPRVGSSWKEQGPVTLNVLCQTPEQLAL